MIWRRSAGLRGQSMENKQARAFSESHEAFGRKMDEAIRRDSLFVDASAVCATKIINKSSSSSFKLNDSMKARDRRVF